MSGSENKAFMRWYDTVHNETFDFQAEIQCFCVNDVVYETSHVLECTQLDPLALTFQNAVSADTVT